MKLKSVTFRCSSSQLQRMEKAMQSCLFDNRTAFISEALEEFLNFAEREDVRRLNLFELVERVDTQGSAASFARHV